MNGCTLTFFINHRNNNHESPVFLLKQLHCYRNIHMYDFHDDAGHHHGSQCKQGIAFKRLDPSLAWALLGTLGNLYL